MKTKEIAQKYQIDKDEFEKFILEKNIVYNMGFGMAMAINDDSLENVLKQYNQYLEENRAVMLTAEEREALELEKKAEVERKQVQLANMLITTGYQFEAYKISRYLDIVSADTVLGTGILSEFGAGLSDLFGVESDEFSSKVQQARESAQKKLILSACEKGANAIIGVDFDYIVLGQNMIGVSVTGTAVVVEKIEETQM